MSATAPGATAPGTTAAAERCLQIDGELSIYRAHDLKALMLATLDGASRARFDLSGVTEIDTAGVQLLLLAGREAAARGIALQLASASPAVRSAFALLELDRHLDALAA